MSLPPPLPTRQVLSVVAGAALLQVLSVRLIRFDGQGDAAALAPGGFLLQFLLLPALLSLLWIWFAAVWGEADGWRRLGLRGPARRWLPAALLAGVGSFILGVAIVWLLTPLLGAPRGLPLPFPLPEALQQPGFALLFAIAAVGIAPVVEELLFRGVVYGWLRARLPALLAALGAALPHALLHGDPPALPALLAVFVVYALAYERCGSLWAAIGAHALHNGLSGLLAAAAHSG